MKKNYFLIITVSLLFATTNFAQVLYSNGFGNLPLQTFVSGSATCQYTTVPNTFGLINDGFNKNVGVVGNYNFPYHVPALKTGGWEIVYNQNVNDTFLVSTSWLDDATLTSDNWILTPTINVNANTVLTWLAMSPDPAYPDGYEVYGTAKTGTLTPADFTIGDRLFALPDGNTTGGGEKNTWTRRSIPLGIFAGQNLRFAFRNNSKNMYQLWIDDVEISNVTNSLNISASSIQTEKYFLTNTSQTLNVAYTNMGSATINSITLNYQYGNSSINTQTFSFANGLTYLQTSTLSFGLPYSISSPGYYRVKSWVSTVNGQLDQIRTDDTLITYVTAQSSTPQKNVLVEQFVSAKDGETPDAQQDLLVLQSNSVVVVNIHNEDSLKDAGSIDVLNDYRKKYSSAMVDRVYFTDLAANTMDRSHYSNRINSRLNIVTPASVTVINKTYNALTRQLSFTLKADFVGEVKGDYRINAYLTENLIYGKKSDTTVNGFNQLSHAYNIPGSVYYLKGYYSAPENAWVLDWLNYKHYNVLVKSFDGSYGNAGLIPSNGGTQGQSYQATYSLTIPTATNGVYRYNPDNMHIVGFVAEYDANKYKRNVLNAVDEKITANPEVIGIKENQNDPDLNIYPNPTTGTLYLNKLNLNKNYDIKIYNLLGKCVWQKMILNVNSTETIDLSGLSNGIYILELGSGTGSFKEKIVIQGN